MMHKNRRVLLATAVALTLAFTAISGLALAQEAAKAEKQLKVEKQPKAEKLPKAQAIIDSYVKAIGGKKLIEESKSVQMVGELQVPAAGIKGSLKIQAMAPNKMLLTAEIPGMGTIRDGFNGELAWAIDPTMGPRLKDGDELAQTEFQADFYARLHAGDRFESMETVERTDLDGAAVYKLRLVTRDGDEMFEYFDVDSNLMLGTELKAETPMGEIAVLTKISDYRTVNGMQVPMKIVQSMGPMEQIMQFNEVTVDELDASVFELPAEIKALTE